MWVRTPILTDRVRIGVLTHMAPPIKAGARSHVATFGSWPRDS